jgi:hypothetical protein
MTLATRLTGDLAEKFFNTDHFAVAGSYSNLANAGTHPTNASTVNGIFDNEYGEVNGMAATRPVFMVESTDVSDATDGAKLTVNSVVYTIRVVQPDGTGVTTLILEAD